MDYTIVYYIFIYGIGIIIIGGVVYGIGRSIWSVFDHSGWKSDSKPDPNAQIIDISSKRVKYSKNGAKYKTTISFSDGFYYITHKTNREQNLLAYKISIDNNLMAEILESAISDHRIAVENAAKKASLKKTKKETKP